MSIISSADDKSSPFGHAAALYRAKGWLGTLPLRPKDKRPWVCGFHGGNKPYPDDAKITHWCGSLSNGNIGLRLGEVQINGELFEIVGLDIDHYESNGKAKRGGDLLAKLEAELGKLPDSPISSARSDGISGIRFFLVPAGLHWYDAGPDFQVIWKGNRYAVAWPSIHPDLLTMYLWYLTGCKPDGNGNGDVPDATALPFLPQPWIDYLTDGNKPFKPNEIDDASDDEIKEWAKANFNDGSAEAMCSAVRFAQDKWVTLIIEEAESYPHMKDGYWELPHLAAEGHTGWNAAFEKVGKTYFEVVAEERRKRPPGAVYGESRRALLGTLKKIKPRIESGELVTSRDSSGECPWCYPGPEAVDEWNKNMAKHLKSEDDDLAEDEEWFWNSRPWLRDLRQFARSRRVGPWGMLGCVLVRILSTIPPHVVLPALVGGYASVNTFIAICGDPASSKSALMKAAEDFLIINSVDVPTYNPGSSEAIPKSFAYIEPGVKAIPATKTKPAQPAQPPHQVGLAWSIVFAIPEIETLLEQRNGNAILAALRSIWSAESSSKRYSGAEHNVRIMPHRARCNVILGVQWDFGDVFFGSIGAGTPQRIIYLPSRDTEQIKIKPESPDPIAVPVWPTDDGRNPTQLEIGTRNLWLADQLDKRQDNFTVFTIPQIAKDEVDNGAMYRSGPEELDNTDPLDGHLLLAREKIAVAFAVMDGIFNGFDADHWKLSSVVIRKSKETRKVLYRKVNEEETRKRNAQAKLAGISRHKAEVAFNEQQDKGTARVAKFIYERLDKSEWTAKRDIKNALPSRDRVFFDQAIEELGERIEVEERLNVQKKPAEYYRRAL